VVNLIEYIDIGDILGLNSYEIEDSHWFLKPLVVLYQYVFKYETVFCTDNCNIIESNIIIIHIVFQPIVQIDLTYLFH